MNIIEKLPKTITINDSIYNLHIYPNVWNNLTINYENICDKQDYLFAVCVEPNNKTIPIENTINCMINSRIGNAPTFDEAVTLAIKYIKSTKIG